MYIFKILIYILSFIVATSCGMIKSSKNASVDKAIKKVNAIIPQDNVVEEYIEDIIEDTTGLIVDLTPETPEKVGE